VPDFSLIRQVLVAISLVSQPALAVELVGAVDVVDGDTFDMGPIRVRLHGIDAAEQGQRCPTRNGGEWRCGASARDRLADLVEGREVICEALDRDPYGRIIARCHPEDGRDLASDLAQSGLAWAFVQFSDDYLADEAVARRARIGVWQADAMPPWEYRANRWERAAAAAPDGCPIKGNISRNGERIYHTPWSPNYAQTVIREEDGEQWFCDEAEAMAAGWRPPRG
jgi:endonuclease YncB( thermonuclease family)